MEEIRAQVEMLRKSVFEELCSQIEQGKLAPNELKGLRSVDEWFGENQSNISSNASISLERLMRFTQDGLNSIVDFARSQIELSPESRSNDEFQARLKEFWNDFLKMAQEILVENEGVGPTTTFNIKSISGMFNYHSRLEDVQQSIAQLMMSLPTRTNSSS